MIEKTFLALQYNDTGELFVNGGGMKTIVLYYCEEEAQYQANLIMQYNKIAGMTFRSLNIISVNLSLNSMDIS